MVRNYFQRKLHAQQLLKACLQFLIFVITIFTFADAIGAPFDLVTPTKHVTIFYDNKECKLDSITANLLAYDIFRVTGYRPKVSSDIREGKGNVILIGSINSNLITKLNLQGLRENLNGKWECYAYKLLRNPSANIKEALVITGSDFRGTAYGVFDISAKIGVTPWYWWADAKPKRQESLSINAEDYFSSEPSVKFRGIFINDEDWGLQPWAAKTFEPETGDIGPKTYAKVFELLLRLKANLIWPAMHPSTKAFFHYPGNIKVAEDYHIVIGSSHAEPMLRNNVSEWNVKTMGPFNYLTNKEQVDQYWESRIKESRNADVIYSMGMRGVHDSGIEGVKTPQETVPLLERIFADQREMLKKYVNPDITKVPQAFTAYKEVLDVYDAGLKVPDDITLIWPDDNYGYIQRLNNEKENQRSGGSGVYYHASYWGRPHDYIWLSSTNPGLIREEMTKAYQMNDHNIWVLNVGDIKPAEYDIQYFLDMAYAIKPFFNSTYTPAHLKNWIINNIGKPHADELTDLALKYYALAFERKPEFMGWSQTEPTTKVNFTAYNHNYYGDQAQQRVNAYTALEKTAKRLRLTVDPEHQAAYYQLIYYPVVAASLMNKKFLYRDKAYLYAREGRISVRYYDSLSNAAYQGIVMETNYYNHSLSNGKWANIMSMHPRDLPVYNPPGADFPIRKQSVNWVIKPEGKTDSAQNSVSFSLPKFEAYGHSKHFIDIFLTQPTPVAFSVSTSASWIKPSVTSGMLSPGGLNSQQRLWVTIDWASIPSRPSANGYLRIKAGSVSYQVAIKAILNNIGIPNGFKGFVEENGYVSMYAKNYQEIQNGSENLWSKIKGLSRTGQSVEALPISGNKPMGKDISDQLIRQRPSVTYRFYTNSNGPAEAKIVTIPTYPLNKDFQMRYAVSIDGGPIQILNFQTFGRSEEWKQAVLSNSITRSVSVNQIGAGPHTIKIYMIDPGVILDRIVVDLGGLQPFYGLLPESKLISKTASK